MKRGLVAALAAACLFAGCMFAGAPPAAAGGYPAHTVTIYVPYAPGGATDIVARVLAEGMHQELGQTFLVENKPGAFGILAIQQIARSAPDGTALMVGNVSTNAITPILYPHRLGIDYGKTILPVTELATLPAFFTATTHDFAPKTLAEFVAYAKAHPGQVRYTDAGSGSFPQFDMELFAKRVGINLVELPANGGAAQIIDSLATGDAEVAFLNVASSAGMIHAGRMRPLAVTTATRLPEWPNVPTMTELGYAGIGTNQWQALFVRAGTPAPIVEAIFKAAVAAMNSPAAHRAFDPANIHVDTTASPAAAPAWLAGEIAKWQAAVKETGFHVN
jgi:tripartite-type tricarboxylate transporter receptor subunit TctC